ncbi:hypothetical protein [Flavobacterium sp.]|uniref:hypothetical protein n=1 Tax=Flavobacterium sp. TaxID=239 RepID=UPI003D6A88CA
MKLKNRFKILLCNAYVVLLCIAIVIVLPLQFVLFLVKGNKNKLVRPLEDRAFKTLFCINDLRKNI